MVYEIVNPSDACTIECNVPKVAFAAVLLLGEGSYGLNDENGKTAAPMLLFANRETSDARMKEAFGDECESVASFPAYLDRNALAVVEVLESFVYGSRGDRRLYTETLALITKDEDKDAWAAKWEDGKRSSMNNIGARAAKYAKFMREKHENRVAEGRA